MPLRSAFATISYTVKLARRLRRLQPDLVHTNTLKSALYGGVAARAVGIPCLWHVRDRIDEDYLPRSAVIVIRVAARFLPTEVVANSRTTLATLHLRKNRRGRVVYDGVEQRVGHSWAQIGRFDTSGFGGDPDAQNGSGWRWWVG